jgi:hypothetical protein
MTTPNTAANGGQILTDERIAEIADATGMMAKNDVLSRLDGGLFCIDFARAIEADLRASRAVPASELHGDGCKFCLGAKGGVPGNANLIGGEVICDYCTSLLMKIKGAEKANPTSSIFTAPAPISGMPDLAKLRRLKASQYGLLSKPDGEYALFADVERLLNPTGESK